MLYTEKTLGQALKKGTFTLSPGDLLTPSARDLLRSRSVSVTYSGVVVPDNISPEKKPEHLTHLRDGEFVPKTHPRIAFRGKMDSLQGELLLLMKEPGAPVKVLEELLDFCRQLMRCDVFYICTKLGIFLH